LVFNQGSVTITLPQGVVILKADWPSQTNSVRAAVAGAGSEGAAHAEMKAANAIVSML
jgi:hypothetical protein